MKQFWIDLAAGQKVEEQARQIFLSLTDEYDIENVSDVVACRHKGDLLATHKETGKQTYLEIKADSRIHDTQNVLCEEENYFYDSGEFRKGNFHYDYEIYCVVSQEARKIYVMDFKVLKKIYKQGTYKSIRHPQEITYCFLLPLGVVKANGGLIDVIEF